MSDSDYAYLGRWNQIMWQPILDEGWISEHEARAFYEQQSQAFSIVPAESRDAEGKVPAAWALTAWSEGVAQFEVEFFSPSGSTVRVIDYQDFGDRTFKWIVHDYTYADDKRCYSRSDCVLVERAEFNPDGTGSVLVNDSSEPTTTRFEADNIDVSGHWMDRPVFGDWTNLINPNYDNNPN